MAERGAASVQGEQLKRKTERDTPGGRCVQGAATWKARSGLRFLYKQVEVLQLQEKNKV